MPVLTRQVPEPHRRHLNRGDPCGYRVGDGWSDWEAAGTCAGENNLFRVGGTRLIGRGSGTGSYHGVGDGFSMTTTTITESVLCLF